MIVSQSNKSFVKQLLNIFEVVDFNTGDCTFLYNSKVHTYNFYTNTINGNISVLDAVQIVYNNKVAYAPMTISSLIDALLLVHNIIDVEDLSFNNKRFYFRDMLVIVTDDSLIVNGNTIVTTDNFDISYSLTFLSKDELLLIHEFVKYVYVEWFKDGDKD